ncbi:MAG: 2-oxoisovalerate dehydrogenase subunit beta [Smithella sp. PtaU1.Bin162]|nr:MAG: 2-oxoisovalerate dehydrogenase subunit beta [Smithella sp. PtaU1.Bin162]
MSEITFVDALRITIKEEMERDPSLLLIGEDIGRYGGIFGVTKGMLDEFGPQRVRSTPISESAIIGSALGAAMTGIRTVAELMYIDFSGVAMDQIINQVAKMTYMSGGAAKVPMVIRTQEGGGRGNAAQHSQCLEGLFLHIPGLKIVMPSNAYDAKGLLKTAIRDDNPVLFIEHKLLYAAKSAIPDEEYLIPLGQADVKRKGKDVTIVTISYMVTVALQAAARLAQEGIEAEVIDLRTLVPLDMETVLKSVRNTNRAVIVHEECRTGGFGAEIAAQIQEEAFDFLDAPVARVGAKDVPIPYTEPLERAVIPQEDDIVKAVRKVLYRS